LHVFTLSLLQTFRIKRQPRWPERGNAHLFRQLLEVGLVLLEALHDVLQRGRHHEVLLLQPQLLALHRKDGQRLNAGPALLPLKNDAQGHEMYRAKKDGFGDGQAVAPHGETGVEAQFTSPKGAPKARIAHNGSAAIRRPKRKHSKQELRMADFYRLNL
jgi:hypothetical protein